MILSDSPKETTDIYSYPVAELGTIEVLLDKEALAVFANEDFVLEWNLLYELCPWSTVFQSSTFVSSWYQHYRNQHRPVLVISRHEGKLTGLLPLTEGVSGLGITGAGGYDAYYHTWLADEKHGEVFINSALQVVKERFPGRKIMLKYIPPKTPMGWLRNDTSWDSRCVTRIFSRPLLDLSDPETDQLVRKKQFREQCNKLKRLGDLKLKAVEDIAEFEAIIDLLADQYDFRKAATHNIMPFRENPSKRNFLLDLFRRGILITYVLKVNDEIVAALTAIKGKNQWVHGAGINTHAPAFSQYSPGYIIMQMFGSKLKQDGYAVFDITPGDHTYKERHSNMHDQVVELRVTSRLKAQIIKHFYEIKEITKDKLQDRGINSRDLILSLRSKLNMAKEQLFLRLLLKGKVRPINTVLKVYKLSRQNLLEASCLPVEKDSLGDLLNYSAKATGVSRWKFMKRAMELYEAGCSPITYSENEQLLYLVWLTPQNTKAKKLIQKDLATKDIAALIPSDAVILHDLYFHPSAVAKVKDFLTTVVSRIGLLQHNQGIYFTSSSLLVHQLFSNIK